MQDSAAPFRVETSQTGTASDQVSAVVMRVVGSLDGANVDELEQQFVRAIDSRPKLVVVDLAGVDVISSIAMGALLRAHQSLRREGGKLLLASVTPPVLSALRRARIDLVVGVRASVDAALAGAAAG